MSAQVSLWGPKASVSAPALATAWGGIAPRPYQEAALAAILARLASYRRAAVEIATGGGKTSLFGALAKGWRERVLILAHRTELLDQARRRVEAMTGELVDLEQGESRSAGSRIVVASVQTMRGARLKRFAPAAFGLIVVDEGHHGAAPGYVVIYKHFAEAKIAIFSATLDRADKKSVLQHEEELVYRWTLRDGIDSGYLCPLDIHTVVVDEVDLSDVKTTAGDLNQGQLAAVVDVEKVQLKIAGSIINHTGALKTLVFGGPTVSAAQKLCEILNRHRPGSAREVNGATDETLRTQTFKAFERGDFQYLVNVGIATEGYDCPSIECVALARFTESRSLYAQMVGRGTRNHPGKASCLVLDFVGIAGRHELITAVDLLCGNYSEEVVKRAKKIVQSETMSPDAALKRAAKEIDEEKARADAAAAAKRAGILAKVSSRLIARDPFAILNVERPNDGPSSTELATPRQVGALRDYGFDEPIEGWSRAVADKLIATMHARRGAGLCSFKQLRCLKKNGIDGTNFGFRAASACIDHLARTNWRRPSPETVAEIVASIK